MATSTTGGAKKASTTTKRQPLVKSVKQAPFALLRNTAVKTGHVKRIINAVKSSATSPKKGRFGK